MDRRSFLTLAAGGLALPMSAFAGTKEPVKLAKAFPYLDAFLKLPAAQRSRFHPAYYLTQAGRPAGGVRAFIIEGATRTPLVIGADGRMSRLPTLAQLQGDAQFQLDAPAEAKFGERLDIEATMAAATQLDAHELALAIAQAAEAVKAIAGPMAFAAPKLAAAAFPGSHGGNAMLPDGRALPLLAGRFGPVYEPAKAPGARTIVLSPAPSRILLTQAV
jgi:hypothetical protein